MTMYKKVTEIHGYLEVGYEYSILCAADGSCDLNLDDLLPDEGSAGCLSTGPKGKFVITVEFIPDSEQS